MQHISDAALPELARIMFKRDAATFIRHAIDMEPDADSVSVTITAGPDSFRLQVDYSRVDGRPLSGWGADL